jgi:NADH:ubiquinone oxidoreductase subunit B-like Fe-S oxidoreductase
MEANGVKWDKGTYQVVNEVAEIVGKDVYDRGLAKRWGENVFEILANLDRKAASDVDQQEQIYELQKKERAMRRQEKTMMEYQQRRGGGDTGRWDL